VIEISSVSKPLQDTAKRIERQPGIVERSTKLSALCRINRRLSSEFGPIRRWIPDVSVYERGAAARVSVLVNGGTVGHADNEDQELPILDLTDESVVVDPPAPEAMQVRPKGFAKTPGIPDEQAGLDVANNPPLGGVIETGKFPHRRLRKFRDPAFA